MKRIVASLVLYFVGLSFGQGKKDVFHVTSVEQSEATDYCTTGQCTATRFTVNRYTRDNAVEYVLDCVEVTDGAGPQKSVEFSFSADRNQLFSAWNAIANLADLAGKVSVTVRADSAAGFDKSKLQNGVLEPLRESDLID